MPLFVKIILIILAVIVGILLFLLFCPVFYKAKLDSTEESKPNILVRASYLCGIVRVSFDPFAEDKLKVWILFLELLSFRKKRAAKKAAKQMKKQQQSQISISDSKDEEPVLEEASESVEEQIAETAFKPKKEKKSIKERFLAIKNKLLEIKNHYDFYKKLLEKEYTKEFLSDAKRKAFHLIRTIFPKSIQGELHYGSDSPDVTGKAYGAYALLLYRRKRFRKFHFYPNFTQEELDFHLKIKGHISVALLLYTIISIYFDRRLRHIMDLINRHNSK